MSADIEYDSAGAFNFMGPILHLEKSHCECLWRWVGCLKVVCTMAGKKKKCPKDRGRCSRAFFVFFIFFCPHLTQVQRF